MSATRPLSNPEAYVREHREDLVYLLMNGDGFVRALALYVLVQGGEGPSIDMVERELQLAKKLSEDELQEVFA